MTFETSLKNLRGAIALALAFAAAACGVSNTPAPQPTEPTHKVFATAATRQSMGQIADKMPIWGNNNVILISSDDLGLNATQKKLIDDNSPQYCTEPNMAKSANCIATRAEREKILVPALKAVLSGLPGLPSDAVSNLLKDPLTGDAANNIFIALPFTHPFSSTPVPEFLDYCLVSLPSVGRTVQEYASYMTGEQIAPEQFVNLPGTGKDWFFLMMAHEAGHCANPKETTNAKEPSSFEVIADRYAIRTYYNETAELESPGLTEAWIAMRALGTYTNTKIPGGDRQHDTSFNLDPGPDQSDQSIASVQEALDNIRKKVMRAKVPPRTPAAYYARMNVLNNRGAFKKHALEQKYATQFLTAAQTYAPAYFGLKAETPASKPAAPGS